MSFCAPIDARCANYRFDHPACMHATPFSRKSGIGFKGRKYVFIINMQLHIYGRSLKGTKVVTPVNDVLDKILL